MKKEEYYRLKSKYFQALCYTLVFALAGAVYIAVGITVAYEILNPNFYLSLLEIPKQTLAKFVLYGIFSINYVLLILGGYSFYLMTKGLRQYEMLKMKLDRASKEIWRRIDKNESKRSSRKN